MLHNKILIVLLVLYFLQPSTGKLNAIHNDFETFRRIKTVNCGITKLNINSTVNCVCPGNDCVYCDYGEIIIQEKYRAYCLKARHNVYFSVMKSSHLLEKEEPESFLQLGRVQILKNESSVLLENKTNYHLGSSSLLIVEELLVVLGSVKKSNDTRQSQELIILTTNVTTKCEEDYVQFTFDIVTVPKAWKITKMILQLLSLFFVLLELYIYLSIRELRSDPYGKCVICYTTAHILNFFFTILVSWISEFAQFFKYVAYSFEFSKYVWINIICYHKLRMIGREHETEVKEKHRFGQYFVIGWTLPILIMVMSSLPIWYSSNYNKILHLSMVNDRFEENKLEFRLIKLPVLLLKGFNLLLYFASFFAIYRRSTIHVDNARRARRYSLYEKNKEESFVLIGRVGILGLMFFFSYSTDLTIYILFTGEAIMKCAYDFVHMENIYFTFESSKYVNGFFFFIYTTSAEKFRKIVRKRIKKIFRVSQHAECEAKEEGIEMESHDDII